MAMAATTSTPPAGSHSTLHLGVDDGMLAAHPKPSPLASPLQLQQHRLSARRGSSAACDPFGTHVDLNHHAGRASSSRLTIVRVVEQPLSAPSTAGLSDESGGSAPSSPGGRRSFNSVHHPRRSGGGGGGSVAESPRLSFANQSFGRSSSPTLNRPHSPGALARASSTKGKRLAPEEIVRLARESGPHAYVPSSSSSQWDSASNSPLGSPVIDPSYLPGHSGIAPASFTELPNNIWLPFIDRPAEVSNLIATPPTRRLFALLAQTLSSVEISDTTDPPPTAEDDATTWSYAQLEHWLCKMPRATADDHTWIRQARICVLAHSELIWERMKGALGVPPELDTSIKPPPALQAEDGSAVLTDDEDEFYVNEPEDVEVSIEPLVRPHTPPHSAAGHEAGASGGLGYIGEEDEEAAEESGASNSTKQPETKKEEDIVQGLRISTAPQLVDDIVVINSPLLPPSHSPALFGQGPSPGPSPSDFHLDASTSAQNGLGAVSAPNSASARPRSSSISSFGSTRSRAGSMAGHNDVSERAGHPLFPSSFAHISATNGLVTPGNTSKGGHYGHTPPHTAMSHGHGHGSFGSLSRRSSLNQQRKLAQGTYAEGYDPSKSSEYAVSTGSARSIKGEDDM